MTNKYLLTLLIMLTPSISTAPSIGSKSTIGISSHVYQVVLQALVDFLYHQHIYEAAHKKVIRWYAVNTEATATNQRLYLCYHIQFL